METKDKAVNKRMCTMDKEKPMFDENELTTLIEKLITEKERYQQEKIARRIGEMKFEQTAEYIAKLFYSDDAYIRNIAIGILASLGEKSLPVLERKAKDKDRNIRKFSLDALKNIKMSRSCEIALNALDDPDENVVEAAVEVIAEQKYIEASVKLTDMLKQTDSVWVLNALIRVFSKLNVRGIAGEIGERILSLDATSVEKRILMNTMVKNIGTIGSAEDIEKVLKTYSAEYMVDTSSLIFGLSEFVVNNDIYDLPQDVVDEIERVFKEYRDYSDADLTLQLIAASVKLQFVYFLDDVKEILIMHKGVEFFIDNLFDLICMLNDIPCYFIDQMLSSGERELILIGLKLIYKKHMCGFITSIEHLCSCSDKEISKLAANIISELDCYKNIGLLESLADSNEEAAKIAIKRIDIVDAKSINFLLSMLEHQNQSVRMDASAKLALFANSISAERIEGIVKRNRGEEGMEALEVLFKIDRNLAWKYITVRLDSSDDRVRARLVEIVGNENDFDYYSIMETMINDPSAAVRKKVIKNLCRKPEERSLQLLEKLLKYESDIANRIDIISNIYRFNNEEAINIAIEASGNSDTLIRLAAVRSLGMFGDARAYSTIRKMLKDPVTEVREAADETLRRTEVMK